MNSFKDKVVYQIYPRSFKDSNGDGFGDIKGITEKLDYLENLGVDYLWITPFFVSPQNDNGYDVADYYNIDSRFGSMEDFDELSIEANKRGIGLMLDMVFNHTSTEHEWFKKALAGDEKYQKYYFFKEGTKDMVPTNWLSKFGGSAWEYEERLNKWYLHLYDKSQADLNWDNKEVRDELKKVILFWKSKGVSGFRFDVINLISKPEIFEDDSEGDGRRFYTDGHRVHEFIKEIVRDTNIEDMITVGEMSSTTLDNCVRYSNPSEKELSMCFSFHHLKVDYKDNDKWQIADVDRMSLKKLFRTWQEGMAAANGWNALFLTNHDQPRIISRFGNETDYFEESGKMLAAMIHLMRGTPYIYQGEEIGMLNTHFNCIEQYKDVESLNYYRILLEKGISEEEALSIINARSRDNGRTPMQWDESEYAGFSKVEPWIEVPLYGKNITVDSQLLNEKSILSFYKKLIALRKQMKVISEGNINFILENNEDVLGYIRSLEGERLIVVCNLTEKNLETRIPTASDQVLISNYDDGHIKDCCVELRPYEFVAIHECTS